MIEDLEELKRCREEMAKSTGASKLSSKSVSLHSILNSIYRLPKDTSIVASYDIRGSKGGFIMLETSVIMNFIKSEFKPQIDVCCDAIHEVYMGVDSKGKVMEQHYIDMALYHKLKKNPISSANLSYKQSV